MKEFDYTRVFHKGDIIKHFKRDFCTDEEKKANKHLYEVVETAFNTETEEYELIYKALYWPFCTFARPYGMALEPVDKAKYPNAKQEYRLEIYDRNKEE